jgi:hypothetical protein
MYLHNFILKSHTLGEAKTKMKRMVLLILVLLLMVDLAADGGLGKVKFVIHFPSPQACGIDSLQADQEDLQPSDSENFLLQSGKGNSLVGLLLNPIQQISQRPPRRPVTWVRQRLLRQIDRCLFSSAGGLPL